MTLSRGEICILQYDQRGYCTFLRDARIKVLEECCDKAEKRIEAALNETKKYSDELRTCKGRNNELESK